jgi:hypothetical protein
MRPTLLARLGCYCSYCEYPVKHSPQAEHIVPKKRFPARRDRWDNLLVSCTYCNTHKGSRLPPPDRLDEYLWPDRDNTALAFTYSNVIPEIAHHVQGTVRNQAALLRGLVKLSLPDDERAKERAAIFAEARSWLSKMSAAPDAELMREAIVGLAHAKGFFSVWMEVFAADPEIRRRLIEKFAGTARDCFDPVTTLPITRPGGRI